MGSTFAKDPQPDAAPLTLLRMAVGYMPSQAVRVIAQLGIADLLKDGPMSTSALAHATQVDERSLRRLLTAAASMGIFEQRSDHTFALNALAEPLRSDVPNSARNMIIHLAADWLVRCWTDLHYSLKTGQPALDHLFGAPLFEFLERQPTIAAEFAAAMTQMTDQMSRGVISSYDFSAHSKVIDVGGGHGHLLCDILEANPHLSAALVDLPFVIEGARPRLEARGLAHRCELVAGDFLETLPADGDAYLLKHVLHDWDDDRAIRILQSCRKAMPARGRALIIETLLSPEARNAHARLMDLGMLLVTGGRERSEAEYRELSSAAGLHVVRVTSAGMQHSIIEAVPA